MKNLITRIIKGLCLFFGMGHGYFKEKIERLRR